MDGLKVFENEEFGQIRELEIDGEPWFVGKDVARALGYSDTINALKSHVDDEDKRGWQITTPGGIQQMTIINVSGIFALIFGSRLPSAKRFKHWVTSEVLPALQKTGHYEMPGAGAKQRELTKDDYIRAASIVAGCRNERLPYVMVFLEQAGFDRVKIGQERQALPGGNIDAPEDGFSRYTEELEAVAWEHKGRSMLTCKQFNNFCAERRLSARKFRKWLYENGYIMATVYPDKTEYAVAVWLNPGRTERCVVFRE